MKDRPDHLEAGRQLLELQLAMMKGAMALMAQSAQRFAELSLGAGASAPVQRQGSAPAVSAAAAPHRPAPLLVAKTARLSAAGKDYALRMQQDVDSILHAFAMVPDTADRLIRTSALLTEKPGKETAPGVRGPAKRAPARRQARRDGAEHAR